jgi:hypothetical protein
LAVSAPGSTAREKTSAVAKTAPAAPAPLVHLRPRPAAPGAARRERLASMVRAAPTRRSVALALPSPAAHRESSAGPLGAARRVDRSAQAATVSGIAVADWSARAEWASANALLLVFRLRLPPASLPTAPLAAQAAADVPENFLVQSSTALVSSRPLLPVQPPATVLKDGSALILQIVVYRPVFRCARHSEPQGLGAISSSRPAPRISGVKGRAS